MTVGMLLYGNPLQEKGKIMLVLSRKEGERIVIGGKVTIVVTRVVGKRVTLGIDAPSDVHVLRGELAEQTPPNQQDRRAS